jgi:hypothetical protein
MQQYKFHVAFVWCFLLAYFLICGVCVVLLKTARIIGIYRKRSICGTCGAFYFEKKIFLFLKP